MGNGMDRMTMVVMIVIVAAVVEVLSPGTIIGFVHAVARQIGLP